MPRCPCPAQALLNTLAARLCAKRKMMAMGRDAKGSARGTARAAWLPCSEKRQKRSDERRRKCHPIHPFARRTPRIPTPPTPTSHTNHHPKLAHTHSLTQKQRTLIFITIIWLFLTNPKYPRRYDSHSSLSFFVCFFILPMQESTKFCLSIAVIPSLSFLALFFP